MIKNKQIN